MKSQKPILLVEDDRVDAMTVKRALRDINVTNQLDVTCNGEEALAFLRDEKNEKPCIILLDLNMPKMNGIEVCMYMRGAKVAEDCHVILVSAGAIETDRQLLNQLGIKHFLIKGGDLGKKLDELLGALNAA